MRGLAQIVLIVVFALWSCRTVQTSGLRDLEPGDGLTAPEDVGLCGRFVASRSQQIYNYGVVRVGERLPESTMRVMARPVDAQSSLDVLVSQFDIDGCDAQTVRQRLTNGLNGEPADIYIYFAGYGGENQANESSGDHELLRWINERDPNSLIFSIGWNCAAAESAGFPFCGARATKIHESLSSTALFDLLSRTTGELLSGGQHDVAAAAIRQQTGQNNGYNRSLAYAIEVGTKLIDHMLMAATEAKIGKIHAFGYSGGAHMAADILREDLNRAGDLPADGNRGIRWSAPDVCEGGGSRCRLADVKKFGWSLALGLSGWSHAMTTYNGLDAQGEPDQEARRRRADYYNGGYLVPSHPDYGSKLRVINRRMDPTGNSDDQLQRAFNDILLSDYNHVSHDYSLPLFKHKVMIQATDAWLDAEDPEDLPALGVIADLAADVNFDECDASECSPLTHYLAHHTNRSHQRIHIFQPPQPVTITDGIATPGSAVSRAVNLRDPSKNALILYPFDQEDLRGGVEFWYRPSALGEGEKGLFNYSACGAEPKELAPRAYLRGSRLVLENFYRDEPFGELKRYAAEVDLSRPPYSSMYQVGKWMHLAFSWELPVVPIKRTVRPDELAGVLENKALHDRRGDRPEFIPSNPLLAFVVGLKNSQVSSMKYQKGQGTLRIHINGQEAGDAAFGSSQSARECLFAPKVVSTTTYFQSYPPYIPYNSYDANKLTAQLGGQISGQLCKAYRVQNNPIHFGCSRDTAVNAGGDMDLVRVVFGEGRREFIDVDRAGAVRPWPVGRGYTSARRQRPVPGDD